MTETRSNPRFEDLLRDLAPQVLSRLSLLSTLDADRRLSGNHRLHAARGHLLEMAGDHKAAITHYRLASRETTSTAERNFLLIQAARLSSNLPEAG